jgi:acetyl esterase
MSVHPIARAILDVYNALPPPEDIGVEAARARSRQMSLMAPRGPDVGAVEEGVARFANTELPVRVYLPAGAAFAPRPVVVYFHGGGFVMGDLDTGDAHCRMFCAGAGCVVVSVNYRHAPEHPFPGPTEDAYGAVCWVADNLGRWNGDPNRIAVAGASAGATLATVATHLARDRGGPKICFQLLLVPGTDMEHDYPSYRENAEGFGLTRNTMRWFGKNYFPDPAQRLHPQASPLRAASLAGLPPAAILTAEFDPMRDEGEASARPVCRSAISVTRASSTFGSGRMRTATWWPICVRRCILTSFRRDKEPRLAHDESRRHSRLQGTAAGPGGACARSRAGSHPRQGGVVRRLPHRPARGRRRLEVQADSAFHSWPRSRGFCQRRGRRREGREGR